MCYTVYHMKRTLAILSIGIGIGLVFGVLISIGECLWEWQIGNPPLDTGSCQVCKFWKWLVYVCEMGPPIPEGIGDPVRPGIELNLFR